MAIVFAATHRNKKRFAVKLLRAELSNHEDIRSRFLREGYVANTVEHPGAVAVLDDDIAEDGSAFLVMELLDGQTVEAIANSEDGLLPLRTVLCVAHQLLDVLAAAHAKGVVHRDIKPANLFITRPGQLKVLDFGIARLRDASSHTTHTGTAMGTPAFMAPEQAGGKMSQVDGLADVWAVGATMFTLVSGKQVHEGESAQEIMVNAATKPARSLSAALPHAPPRAVALVDRALAFSKGDRWASAEAMRDEVRDTYAALFGEAISQAPLASVVARPPRVVQASHPDLMASGSQAFSTPTLDARSMPAMAALALTAAVPGVTTEQPVSRGAAEPPAAKRRPTALIAAVIVIALAVVAMIGTRALRGPPDASTPTVGAEPPAASSPSPVATSSTATATPTATATATPTKSKPKPGHGPSAADFDRQ